MPTSPLEYSEYATRTKICVEKPTSIPWCTWGLMIRIISQVNHGSTHQIVPATPGRTANSLEQSENNPRNEKSRLNSGL